MVQQTFPVDTRRPSVVINNLDGNLNVQPWENKAISVDVQGEVEVLRQEGDVLMITHCHGDLTLWVPAIVKTIFPITTSVSASGVSRSATLVKAGNVSLRNVGGQVVLRDIYGNVDLDEVQESAEATNIGGNLQATHMPRFVGQNVGGNAYLSVVGDAQMNAIGGNLDVARIESRLQCNNVGGNCSIHDCASSEVSVRTVGGNLHCDGSMLGLLSSVGGNLHLASTFLPGSQHNLQIGGNGHITLPADANVTVHATIGGNASGPGGTYKRGGGFVNLVYGEGSANLQIMAGGNLSLAGCEPRR